VHEETPEAHNKEDKVIAFAPLSTRLSAVVPNEAQIEVQKSGNLLVVQPQSLSDVTPVPQENLKLLPFEKPTSLSFSRASVWKIAAGSVLLLAAVGLLIYYSLSEATEPKFTAKSIAVLPFQSTSATNGDREFDMGMTDSLITRLGQVKHIVVRPISAVSKYAKGEQDVFAAGRELQAQTILDGSVQRVAGDLRVTVRLLDTRDGSILWTQQFDEKAEDIFRVQDSISERVVKELAIKMDAEERRNLIKHSTENLEAYELYVKGRYNLTQLTEKSGDEALGNFTQAIAIDPNYAEAYAGLANLYSPASDIVLSPEIAMPRARENAAKALALDDSLDEAHLSMARIKWFNEWKWAEGEVEFKRALELNSSNLLTHLEYGHFLMAQSRFDEALGQMKMAQEIDPQSMKVRLDLGWIFYSSHRSDHAIEVYREALTLDANSASVRRRIGLALAQKGNYPEAIVELKKAIAIKDDHIIQSDLGYVYALAGYKEEALRSLMKLSEQAKGRYVSPYAVARVYSGLGDKKRMFQALEKAYQIRADQLTQIQADPVFDQWHGDPQYKDLTQRLGFAP
jgi:TolB-like protein/Tfp pilus assembly protein PilF